MRKRIITLALILIGIVSAQAQIIYIDEEDQGLNPRATTDLPINVIVPMQDTNIDQYLPLGDGWLLLMGLGGAYLLKRRKRKE